MTAADIEMLEAGHEAEFERGKIKLLEMILSTQPKYIGILPPAAMRVPTFRLVMPNPKSTRHGRGFNGLWEEVILETPHREDVDRWIQAIETLVGQVNGPIAMRHIVNDLSGKDEGLRFIWPSDGEQGEMEMRDWPRRDALIRDGKIVQPMQGGFGWIPDTIFPGTTKNVWGVSPVKGLGGGQYSPVSPIGGGQHSGFGGGMNDQDMAELEASE